MEVVGRLVAALGDAVALDPATLSLARGDKSGHRSASAPLAVVNARSVEDVQETLRIATATQTPVVTRGAGTGLAGGAAAGDGEIVISTLAMNRILEISMVDELVRVEPGIINGELNRELAAHGSWFAPDPASRAISTVGGNIATNAGGLLCAKYGVTREAVLGLKVVLADGRLLSLGHRTVKGVTGYDLTALMIGSEGTLGVIVEATLKTLPIVVGPRATIGAYFDSVNAASLASSGISASGVQPAIMEIVGQSAMSAIATHSGLPDPGKSFLLVQTDGPGAAVEAERTLAIIRENGGVAEYATGPVEAEELLSLRRSFHSALVALGTVLIEDVCVPRSALSDMFAAIGEIEARYGISVPTVAHAGDGNLHPNFVFEGPEVPGWVWSAADEVFAAALRLGGTLTGEHGVGTLKRRWLAAELGQEQFGLQREVKRVFDPLGILNPGKVF